MCMKYRVKVKSTHFFDFSTTIDNRYALLERKHRITLGYLQIIQRLTLAYPPSAPRKVQNIIVQPPQVSKVTNSGLKK